LTPALESIFPKTPGIKERLREGPVGANRAARDHRPDRSRIPGRPPGSRVPVRKRRRVGRGCAARVGQGREPVAMNTGTGWYRRRPGGSGCRGFGVPGIVLSAVGGSVESGAINGRPRGCGGTHSREPSEPGRSRRVLPDPWKNDRGRRTPASFVGRGYALSALRALSPSDSATLVVETAPRGPFGAGLLEPLETSKPRKRPRRAHLEASILMAK
jgi:hypothetical protein